MDDLVWAVKIGDATMQVRDLPIATLDTIAKATEVSWAYVVAMPFGDLRVAERLLAECAKTMGVDAPAPESLTARTIIGYFEQVTDDLPELLENGVPQ